MALPIANVAKYELTLPSQQKKIKYRPFLVKEEKILLMALETQKPEDMLEAVKNIVKSCTFNEINPEDYPMFDLEYIFLQIRAKSVGENAKIKVLCPDDKKTYETIEVDLSKVEVYVEDDHSNNVVLDEDRKLGVVLNYPSLKIINSGILTGDVKLAQMYELIVNSIEQIYEGDKVHMAKDTDKKELDDFVNNLSGEQMRKIQNFFETMPRLEQKVKVMNSKTKVESEVTLKGLADFFG
jgi:hemoglobin-like flavoprotein